MVHLGRDDAGSITEVNAVLIFTGMGDDQEIQSFWGVDPLSVGASGSRVRISSSA